MKYGYLCGAALAAFLSVGVSAHAAQYLVTASDGPSFNSPEEAVQMLERVILPTFDALQKLEKEHRITGGLPVGDRAFTFILEAESNADADKTLRELPAWPLLTWKVTALQSFGGRADVERAVVAEMKKASKTDK